jgi:hypothetical protein
VELFLALSRQLFITRSQRFHLAQTLIKPSSCLDFPPFLSDSL